MRITFHGAVRTVTGSQHLLEVNGKKILLDCGLYQGKRADANRRNATFRFEPKDIDALVLSHAHMDHAGNIPTLVKRGFKGNIYCTPATRDLCGVMLMDSAFIQQKDAEFLNKRRKDDEPAVEALYGAPDVQQTLKQMICVPYQRPMQVTPGVSVTFRDCGHILGSASVTLDCTEGTRQLRVAFTGDVGRREFPILHDPDPPQKVDVLISESTYGDRLHSSEVEAEDELAGIVQRVYRRGGIIVMPAFAVGRTQTVVYHLHKLHQSGKIPNLPIYVDSPLAVNVTSVYKLHPECYDADTLELMDKDSDPFGFRGIRYVQSVEESKRLNDVREPVMIISASGMCEAGRVLHHLRNRIGDARNMVLLGGFQAEHTLGRRLQEGAVLARIYGEEVPVKAEVKKLEGMSAHADRDGLLAFAKSTAGAKPPKTFLVHGEEDVCLKFQTFLKEKGFADVTVPIEAKAYEL
jgi:metallo-beta-lactamase family protein